MAHIPTLATLRQADNPALFGLVGGLVVTLFFGVRTWRKSSSYWMMPSFICLVGLSAPFIILPLGEALNDWDFKKHLGDYERIINEIKVEKFRRTGCLQQSILRV
jgi:hypothetical protein